jgi:hypothetical protein
MTDKEMWDQLQYYLANKDDHTKMFDRNAVSRIVDFLVLQLGDVKDALQDTQGTVQEVLGMTKDPHKAQWTSAMIEVFASKAAAVITAQRIMADRDQREIHQFRDAISALDINSSGDALKRRLADLLEKEARLKGWSPSQGRMIRQMVAKDED